MVGLILCKLSCKILSMSVMDPRCSASSGMISEYSKNSTQIFVDLLEFLRRRIFTSAQIYVDLLESLSQHQTIIF